MRNITLKDVAKLAGVSVGTVSRYINHHPSVSEKNARKIQAAIDKLEYVPNLTAQNLAKGISNNILLYIIQEDPILMTTWLYELPIIQGINDYLKNTEYSLQIAIDSIDDCKSIKKSINKYINNKLVDGLMILTTFDIDKSIIIRLVDSKYPFVLTGIDNSIQPENGVLFDNYGAINQIMAYLYKLGHRKIGFIGGTKEQQHAKYRKKAYFDSIRKFGLTTSDKWVKDGDYSVSCGYNLMNEILSAYEQPTAIVCGNDYIAAGAIKAIREKGLDVPYDYSVTGFDNNIISEIVEPNITTMSIPLQEVAEFSIKKLINIIKNPDQITQEQIFSCKMIVGGSTSKPKL